jgi:hypothetical protein
MKKLKQKAEHYIHSHIGLLVTNRAYTRIRKTLGEYLRYMYSRLSGSLHQPVRYFATEDRKLFYIHNSKAACSSIKLALLKKDATDIEIGDDQSIHLLIKPVSPGCVRQREPGSIVFSFVRSPFERLVSIYLNKFKSVRNLESEGFYFQDYLNGIFTIDMSFDNFVNLICKIPDNISDNHFRSQAGTVFKDPEIKPDFIGKIENFQDDWEKLNKLAGARIKIEHYNSSGKYDYRKFYTPDLVELVAERYRDDINLFGYENAYSELLEYTSRQAPYSRT